jgi:diguanylate cyclase (GGDEF)-like protein
MPELPVFCFCSTIFMIEFFIQSIDVQISTDPLTRLNNRGQFESYINQESNLRIEGRKTYAVMMDINDFKMINDTFGHAEGDRALVIMSQALIDSVRDKNIPIFLGRYGGDEFVLIAHPVTDTEMQNLLVEIREKVVSKCEDENRPYILSIGIGYEEFSGAKGTFAECMKQADEKLYKNKEELKKNGKSTKKRHTT